jgi:hypothetical protein
VRDDAPDEAGKKYAIYLADTVAVKPGGAAPDLATATATKDWKDVAYYFKVSFLRARAEQPLVLR